MSKKLFDAVVTALTRCPQCKGKGQIEHYIQGCNEVIKGRAVVGYTDCTTFKTCDMCNGTGRPR